MVAMETQLVLEDLEVVLVDEADGLVGVVSQMRAAAQVRY